MSLYLVGKKEKITANWEQISVTVWNMSSFNFPILYALEEDDCSHSERPRAAVRAEKIGPSSFPHSGKSETLPFPTKVNASSISLMGFSWTGFHIGTTFKWKHSKHSPSARLMRLISSFSGCKVHLEASVNNHLHTANGFSKGLVDFLSDSYGWMALFKNQGLCLSGGGGRISELFYFVSAVSPSLNSWFISCISSDF